MSLSSVAADAEGFQPCGLQVGMNANSTGLLSTAAGLNVTVLKPRLETDGVSVLHQTSFSNNQTVVRLFLYLSETDFLTLLGRCAQIRTLAGFECLAVQRVFKPFVVSHLSFRCSEHVYLLTRPYDLVLSEHNSS